MVLAGETIIAGRVPGERIATDIATTDSAGITNIETVVQSVTAAVVTGRIYKVTVETEGASTEANHRLFWKIREDDVAGNALMFQRQFVPTAANYPARISSVEYTADATEDKTFVVTLVREVSPGTVHRDASPTSPSYLYVDYVRG